MPPEPPSPIEPLGYARPGPPQSSPPRWARLIPSRRARRWFRLIYYLVCLGGLIYVVRFLLHYRQLLEDAMKQK